MRIEDYEEKRVEKSLSSISSLRKFQKKYDECDDIVDFFSNFAGYIEVVCSYFAVAKNSAVNGGFNCWLCVGLFLDKMAQVGIFDVVELCFFSMYLFGHKKVMFWFGLCVNDGNNWNLII